MVNRLSPLILLLALGVFMTGCPKQPDPNPEDTILGDAANREGSSIFAPVSSRDFTDPLSDPSEGLYAQDSRLTDGERLHGVLQPVYFDFDQSFVRPDQRDALMRAHEYLRSNPRTRLLVEGHCDYRGTTEYNLALGDRRATSVKEFLVQLGVDASRIETLSKGDLEAVQGASDERRQRDRRAELIVIR